METIDRSLHENERERAELLKLRELAVIRHGDSSPAPAPVSTPPPPPPSPPEAENRECQRAEATASEGDDWTVAKLIEKYRTDPSSPYASLQHATRKNYEVKFKNIDTAYGAKRLVDLQRPEIERIYDLWAAGGRISSAHDNITMLRMLLFFGSEKLKDPECARLSFMLHRMKFATPERKEREILTSEHVTNIIRKARAMGFQSIALAQAIQFECKLSQKDVIGEWMPESEPGDSETKHEGNKWLLGLVWQRLSTDYTLLHRTTRGITVELKLKEAPLVMKHFADQYQYQLPRSGPMIISEVTGRPWTAVDFRRKWREIANAAGVPKSIRNMDSRKERDPPKPRGAVQQDMDIEPDREAERSSILH